MRCEFIGPDSGLWSRFLADSAYDFYHLPRYVELSATDPLCAPNRDGQPLAFHADDDNGRRFLLALIVRPIPAARGSAATLYDAITPYGYASPLVIGPSDDSVDSFLAEAIRELSHGLKSRGIVSAFVRTHPLFPYTLERIRRNPSSPIESRQ